MSLIPILRTHDHVDWSTPDAGFVNLPINCAASSDVNWPWKYWTQHEKGSDYQRWDEIIDTGLGAEESQWDNNTGIFNNSKAGVEVAFAYIATDPVPIQIELTASCYYGSGDNEQVFQGRGLTMDVRLIDFFSPFIVTPVTYLFDWMGTFTYYEQQFYYGELPATALPQIVYARCIALADLDANARIEVSFPEANLTP